MRYVQLRAFHHVAICGGFSRAAEMLHLTQPAISDQVRKLEEEYDILLFDRSKKQVVLTPAGEDLLEITRRLFDMESQALDLLSESRALRTGHLRVIADAAHHVLPIISAFRARYPVIRISFMAGNTETVISALQSYEADIGVIGEMPLGRDYEVLRLNSTPILAMVPKGHPLARQGSASLKVLAGHPLVLRERGSKTRAKLEEEALRQGIALEAAIEAEGREAVREIVAAGAGIGFVSAAEFGHDARLIAVTIDDAGLFMDEALICLRERSSAKLVQAFFTLARSL